MPENQLMYNKDSRLHILDLLRGLAIIFVIVYHTLYDIEYVFNLKWDFLYTGVLDAVHGLFLADLFIVSGICTSFSHNLYKRAGVLIVIGQAITIVTSVVIPDKVIIFGAITFFGTSMLLYALIQEHLKKIRWEVLFGVSIALYVLAVMLDDNGLITSKTFGLPSLFTQSNPYLYPLGITTKDFFSADYFPLIPNFFLFLVGTALSVPVRNGSFPKWFYSAKFRSVEFLGRNTLVIYIVHQPIIMAAVIAVSLLIK